MLSKHHVTRSRVRGAVKTTRQALNRALDAAEPKLEKVAVDLQDLSTDALKALRKSSMERLDDLQNLSADVIETFRKSSLARLDDLKDGYGKLEKRARKQLPKRWRHRGLKLALVAAGVTVLAFGIFR